MTAIAELERIAREAVAPAEATDVVAVVDVTEGGKLSNGYPSGIGVLTRYGVAWFDGLRRSAPIALFDRSADAHRLIHVIEVTRFGRTARSAPRFVPEATGGRRRAEGGAVPAGPPADRTLVPADAGAAGLTRPARRRSLATAGSPPGTDTHERPGVEPSGVPASQGADALAGASSDGGSPETERAMVGLPTSPGRSFCKACGRDLAELPPSRSGQHRQTCDDACRQAYHRGQRAPIAGVVDAESIERLSRLHAPLPTAEERAVAREARAMQSIAEYG